MKKFIIAESALKRIKVRAAKLPLLNNSIRKGEGSLVAYIGEEVVKNVLKGEIKDTYDYDIVYKNTKVDVKTKELFPLGHITNVRLLILTQSKIVTSTLS